MEHVTSLMSHVPYANICSDMNEVIAMRIEHTTLLHSQAFPLSITCILQAIANWMVGRPVYKTMCYTAALS